MLAFSKLRKAFEIPYYCGFRRNQNALKKFCVASEEPNPEEPNPQLGLRFCVWVTLKFELEIMEDSNEETLEKSRVVVLHLKFQSSHHYQNLSDIQKALIKNGTQVNGVLIVGLN